MLPSRLFRNTGIPPALRSLITPHASLPSTVAVQLRFRLGVLPGSTSSFSTSNPTANKSSPPKSPPNDTITPPPPPPPSEGSSALPTTHSQPLPEKIEPRLSLTFTCTAPGCSERSTHQFTKRAYEKGIVLVQCPGCKNRHLIADHLGWFKEGTQDGKLRTVEDILRAKGEKVTRGVMADNGDVEYAE